MVEKYTKYTTYSLDGWKKRIGMFIHTIDACN